jgi:hypothetical protein
MKLLFGLAFLASASVALASNDVPYPKEKVAEFVVEKLDVTTLPSEIRPKRDKGKKTFGDYGYVTRQLDEKEVVEAAPGGSQISIKILEQKSSRIYVCVAAFAQNASSGQIQRVVLLKIKNTGVILKGKESWKEFEGCPAIGGTDHDSTADSYSGG